RRRPAANEHGDRDQGQGRPQARARRVPAQCRRQPLDAALRRRQHGVRQRLDAGARQPQARRLGPRLRAVGPCRLARPHGRHRRHRCAAHHRHARQRAGHGAIPRRARFASRGLRHRVRRRCDRGGRSHGRRRMKRFAALFAELDATTSINAKVEALRRYFEQAPQPDAAWAVYFLAGGKPRQVVPMGHLAMLACEVAGVAPWLFDECYQAVGDLAETIALVLPPGSEPSDVGLAEWVEERLLPLRGLSEPEIAARVKSYWSELDTQERFLLTKLVGGGFRVGVSKLLVQRALAAHAQVDAKRVAQRMMGYTDGKVMPSLERFQALVARHEEGAATRQDEGQPYPFFLAHQLDAPLEVFAARLGPVTDWQVEWKYDGIRGQVVKRSGRVWIW